MSDSIAIVIEEWMTEWIIKENFCPFAKPALLQNQINIHICEYTGWSQVLESLCDQCNSLLQGNQYTTCLFVLNSCADDFFDYLALLEAAQIRLEQEGWLGTFQLASFHPNYVFDNEEPESVSNFTNRSPLPIIHILREDDITQALSSERLANDYAVNVEKLAEKIVKRNIRRLEQIGIHDAKTKLDQWQQRIAFMVQSTS